MDTSCPKPRVDTSATHGIWRRLDLFSEEKKWHTLTLTRGCSWTHPCWLHISHPSKWRPLSHNSVVCPYYVPDRVSADDDVDDDDDYFLFFYSLRKKRNLRTGLGRDLGRKQCLILATQGVCLKPPNFKLSQRAEIGRGSTIRVVRIG